ncbi:MAG TPA: hypothetical protein VGC15_14275 [Acetobacteraceae bacterium]
MTGRLSDDTPAAGRLSQAGALVELVGVAGARAALSAVEATVDLARVMVLTATPAELASGALAGRLLHLLPDAGWREEVAALELQERRADAYGRAYHKRHYFAPEGLRP